MTEFRYPRYVLDENMSRRVAEMLQARGREAIESRQVVGAQAADTVVEWVAATESLVLISLDRHFKGIVEGISRKRLRRTGIALWMDLEPPRVLQRLEQCLEFVEYQIRDAEHRGLTLLYVQITEHEAGARYHIPNLDSPHNGD